MAERCVDGRLMRHDPQPDDPYLETDIGKCPDCDGAGCFDEWIRALSEDVIQEGFGYEPGEFAVYPELWRAAFDEGLTPTAAFTRALDAFTEKRNQDDLRRTENWKRIQIADARIKP